MSASLLVDLYNTTSQDVSIVGTPVQSGAIVTPCSGAVVGAGVDMIDANTYCNLFVTGYTASGQLRVQVQTAASDVSGNYTDPTSGLAAFPGAFVSGGILWINSGGTGGGIFQAWASGQQAVASGFFAAQGFQRPARFARAVLLSGDFATGPITVGFISQLKTTGSGGGASMSPSSGAVQV